MLLHSGFENILIINGYMPVDNQSKSVVHEDFLDGCDLIETLVNKYSSHRIIFGGDINADCGRKNAHDIYYLDTLRRCDMVDIWSHFKFPVKFTYIDHCGGSSCIDRFAVKLDMCSDVVQASVLDCSLHMSYHWPIYMVIRCNLEVTSGNKLEKSEKVGPHIAWHKVNDELQLTYQY